MQNFPKRWGVQTWSESLSDRCRHFWPEFPDYKQAETTDEWNGSVTENNGTYNAKTEPKRTVQLETSKI